MLRIRLSRGGRKNAPVYKVVVAEASSPVKGKFVEALGMYNPMTKEQNIKADRVQYWISVGAQPSRTVHNLLVRHSIIEAPKVKVTRSKAPTS
jgi:small subunit ribosomal protein S16